MKLYYQSIGLGSPIVILHGLFGCADNWRSLAKKLAEYGQVITVDLRNHGCSPHSPQQSYPLMVADLLELFDDLGLEKANIIGHSMGGKVAMQFTASYPQRVNKLLIVDIAPRKYADEHSSIFTALLAVDLANYASRSEVDAVLASPIPDKATRQFLLMNLVLDNGVLRWRINLTALDENYQDLLAAVCQQQQISNASCFIAGGRSPYIQGADKSLILDHFPQAKFHTIEQAGHWLHVEAPQQLLTKIQIFFADD